MSHSIQSLEGDVLSPVSEEQKQSLLREVQELYEGVAGSDWYYSWPDDEENDCRRPRSVAMERNKTPTPEEWLVEETGTEDWHWGWETFGDQVFKDAEQVVREAYRESFGDDWLEDDELARYSSDAECKLYAWLEHNLRDLNSGTCSIRWQEAGF